MIKKLLKFSLSCTAVLAFSITMVAAQDSLKNEIGIHFGLSNLHVLDEHANFLIFRGTGIAPSIGYNRRNNKNMHIIEGSFYRNNLESGSDNYKTTILAGQFRYSYLRTVINRPLSDHHMCISAGVSASSFFIKSDYLIYMQTFWGKAIESWYGSHSVDLAASVNYDLGERNKFSFLFFMPVVSNVSRPAYSSSGDYNYEKNDWDVKVFGKTVIFPENLVFNIHFSYQYRLKKRMDFKAEYSFFFAKYQHPDLIQMYMNNMRMGIIYRF